MSRHVEVRRSKPDDFLAIEELIAQGDAGPVVESRFGKTPLTELLDSSLFSISAVGENGEVYALATFNDIPPPVESNNPSLRSDRWHSWLAKHYSYVGITETNTLWMTFFHADPLSSLTMGETLLKSIFATLPWVECVLYLLPQYAAPFTPMKELFDEYESTVAQENMPVTSILHGCMRSTFVPEISVRRARVEDHDDLVPVFNRQSAALTEIYGDFFLAELIESQNESNQVVVAECNAKAVGLMSLTADLDIRILQKCFELYAYDNLLRVESQQDIQRVEDVEHAAQRNLPIETHFTDTDVNAFCITLFCVDSTFESRTVSFLRAAFDVFPNRDYCLLTLPHSAPRTPLLEHFTLCAARPANTFSHVLYLVHRHSLIPDLSVRAIESADLAAVGPLLASLENSSEIMKHVCATVKQPTARPSIVPAFNPAGAAGAGLSSQFLFADHELDAKAAEFLGRPAPSASTSSSEGQIVPQTTSAIALSCLPVNGQLATSAMRRDQAFLFCAQGQPVGVAVLQTHVYLDHLKAQFVVEDVMPPASSETPQSLVYLKYFVLNPLFARRTRHLLKELIRMGRHTQLFYRVFPGDLVQPVLEEMVQVRPRPQTLKWNYQLVAQREKFIAEPELQRAAEAALAESIAALDAHPHALHTLSRRLLSQPKQVVTARLVVVGASETAFAFLESLFTSSTMHFANVTLLSTRGMPVRDVDADFSTEPVLYGPVTLTRLALQSKLRVVADKLVDVDRAKKVVRLPDGSVLPYDFLILTPGLQTQQIEQRDGDHRPIRDTFELYVTHGKPVHKLSAISAATTVWAAADAAAVALRASLFATEGAPTTIAATTTTTGPVSAMSKLDALLKRTGGTAHTQQTPSQLLQAAAQNASAAEIARRDHRVPLTQGVITMNGEPAARQVASLVAEHEGRLSNVLVCGPLLSCVCAVRGLLRHGVPGESISVITPRQAFSNTQAAAAISSQMQFIHPAVEARLWMLLGEFGVRCVPNATALRTEQKNGAVAAVIVQFSDPNAPSTAEDEARLPPAAEPLEEAAGRYRVPCDLMLNCSAPSVDPTLFLAADRASLVFDGRLVVDSSFKTCDSCIFAAGPVAKFARRYASQTDVPPAPTATLTMDRACSREIGQLLATSFVDVVACTLVMQIHEAPPRAPVFNSPKLIAAILPGEQYFLAAAVPTFQFPVGVRRAHAPPVRHADVDQASGAFALTYDDCSLLKAISYAGPRRLPVTLFAHLAGLPYTYANELINGAGAMGNSENAIDHFELAWASPLYHSVFVSMRTAVQTSMYQSPDVRALVEDVLERAENDQSFDLRQLLDVVLAKLKHLDSNTSTTVVNIMMKSLYLSANHLPGFTFPDNMI